MKNTHRINFFLYIRAKSLVFQKFISIPSISSLMLLCGLLLYRKLDFTRGITVTGDQNNSFHCGLKILDRSE